MNTQVPPEKLHVLRALIDSKLRDEGIYSQLRSLIQSHVGTVDPPGIDSMDGTNDILHNVLESDVVQQLIASIQPTDEDFEKVTASSSDMTPTQQTSTNMVIQILGGRAFVDQLLVHEPEHQGTTRSCFKLEIAFHRQRFISALVPCTIDPGFHETFTCILDYSCAALPAYQVTPRWEALCLIKEPLHITVTKHHQTQNDTNEWVDLDIELVAAQKLDWRQYLTSPHSSIHIPLSLDGPMKVPVGVLDIRLEFPQLRKSIAINHEAKQWLQKEQLTIHGCQSHVYQYCKQWWSDYLRSYPSESHSHNIKLFAQDECHKYRLVCTFITPIQSRFISNPSEAVRFVSLIPFVRETSVGSTRDVAWHSLATFLALGKGDCIEHAILLTSLLVGFGLSAFMCIGSIKRKELNVQYTWVITILKSKIIFFDSITGEKFTPLNCPFESIDYIFNNNFYYANCQHDIKINKINWNLNQIENWKSIDTSLILQIPNDLNIFLIPPIQPKWDEINKNLKKWIESIRYKKKYTTKWHLNLSHYIQMSLSAYEIDRLYEISNIDNDYFQSSIHHTVPQGYTFKGFPLFGKNIQDIQEKLISDVIGREILYFHHSNAQYGLGLKCISYPEGILVIWVMIAVIYQNNS